MTTSKPAPDQARLAEPSQDGPDDARPKVSPTARRRYALLGLAAAAQLMAVGGPWDIPLAAWILPILLLRFSRTSRPLSGVLLVWLVCFLGAIVWWYEVAAPSNIAVFVGLMLFGTIGTVPYVVDRLVQRRLRGLTRALAFPAAMVSVQYVLGTFSPFGTAYGLSAVTQRANLALLQVISVLGPYVIAFLIGLLAAAVNSWWEGGLRFELRQLRQPLIAVGLIATVIVLGQARMAWAPADTSTTVRIAGINPDQESIAAAEEILGTSKDNIAEVASLESARVQEAADVINQQLFDDTVQAARSGAQIVMWSEHAALVPAGAQDELISRARTVTLQHDIYLNLAMRLYPEDASPLGLNRTVLVGPEGNVLWTYDKQHPVPGSEPTRAGDEPAPVVETPYGRISNLICYDADFPADARIDADIMLVPGVDWPEIGRLHSEMAKLRAIENGYAVVRQAFASTSMAFDHQGKLLSQQDTTSGQDDPWIVDVPTQGTDTLYRIVGDVFAWLCIGGSLALLGLVAVRIRRRTPSNQEK